MGVLENRYIALVYGYIVREGEYTYSLENERKNQKLEMKYDITSIYR